MTKREELDDLQKRMLNQESVVTHLSEIWVKAYKKEADENAALRAERVGLQGENEQLRNAHQRIDDLRDIVGADAKQADTPDLIAQIETLAKAVAELDERLTRLGDPTAPVTPAPVLTGLGVTLTETPVRGDRVQLVGVYSTGGRRIPDGWYDVIGQKVSMSAAAIFQVATRESEGNDTGAWLPWVLTTEPGIRDIRRSGEIGGTHGN